MKVLRFPCRYKGSNHLSLVGYGKQRDSEEYTLWSSGLTNLKMQENQLQVWNFERHRMQFLTRSDVLSHFSSILQLSQDHWAYENPPEHVEHKQHQKHCVENIIHRYRVTFWEIQEFLNIIAGKFNSQQYKWKNRTKSNKIRTSKQKTNLDDLITQKGKNTSLRRSQEMAKSPKNILAPSSLPEYLKILAASINTSLVSCRARIIEPIRKNLQKATYSLSCKIQFQQIMLSLKQPV